MDRFFVSVIDKDDGIRVLVFSGKDRKDEPSEPSESKSDIIKMYDIDHFDFTYKEAYRLRLNNHKMILINAWICIKIYDNKRIVVLQLSSKFFGKPIRYKNYEWEEAREKFSEELLQGAKTQFYFQDWSPNQPVNISDDKSENISGD